MVIVEGLKSKSLHKNSKKYDIDAYLELSHLSRPVGVTPIQLMNAIL